jgi:hypothetical protein
VPKMTYKIAIHVGVKSGVFIVDVRRFGLFENMRLKVIIWT